MGRPRIIDLVSGDMFGAWTVVAELPMDGAGRAARIRHSCGNVIDRSLASLRNDGTPRCWMCRPPRGQMPARVGPWTILEELTSNGKKRRVRAKCDCGVEATRLWCDIRITARCPHVRERGPTSVLWKGCGELSSTHFSEVRGGAIARDLAFDITIEELWALFVAQNRRCAISGVPLSMGTAKGRPTASVDRIDSLLGYVAGNLQWVHRDVNLMKRSMTDAELVRWCRLIVAHQERPNERQLNLAAPARRARRSG